MKTIKSPLSSTRRMMATEFAFPGLDPVIQFNGVWPREFNSLLIGPDDKLYLADTENEELILADGSSVPIHEGTAKDVAPVSLKSALEWFANVSQWVEKYTGSPERLCALAADAL